MLSYASSRFRNGQTKTCSPSRFIRDIDTQYLNMSSGTSIGGTSKMVNPVDNYRKSFHSSYSTGSKKLQPLGGRNSNVSRSSYTTSSSAPTTNSDIHDVKSLSEGMIIEHQRFGTGKITTIDTSSTDARIVVEFANTGTKTLLLKFARFKILG